jgi:hypothetical protein
LLGDKDHIRWPTDVIDDRLELAQTEVQALTNAVKTVETLTPTANTAEVTVDDDTLDILRVTLTQSDGTITTIAGRTREDLDFYVPTWPNMNPDLPKNYYFDASNAQLVLVPAPSSAYALSNSLKVWEVRIPAAMTSDTSVPFDASALMRAYQMSLVHWVVAVCFMDNGDPESLAKSKFHKTNDMNRPGEYEKVIKLINAKFDSPVDVPARILGPYPQGGRLGGVSRPNKANPIG